jgi:predicted dehydrogenase
MTKVLLLGIGRWGANHVRVLKSLPIELFVSDLNPKSFDIARKVGVADDHLSTNYKDFAGKVDAAVIVTPAQSHFPLAKEFLEAGKDVFVEKPLTLVPDESKQLAELAAKKGRLVQVGHIFRFDPATQWLREQVQAGAFGKVRILRGHFGGFKRPRNDSGVMFADGIHFVDLFNHILGAVPTRVRAEWYDFLGRGPGFDDASRLSMEYDTASGRTWATVEAEYFIPGKFRDVIVIGDKLTAVCDYNLPSNKIKIYANVHVPEGKDFKGIEGVPVQVETAAVEPLLAELKAFTESIITRKAPLADAWAGYDAVRVLTAAMEANKFGGWVAL